MTLEPLKHVFKFNQYALCPKNFNLGVKLGAFFDHIVQYKIYRIDLDVNAVSNNK